MEQGRKEKHLFADVLVVGGGMAGLFAAIKSRERGLDVIQVDKNFVGRSGGTHYAEGDIQFFRPKRGHTIEAWMKIINQQAEYINNPEWNEIMLLECEDRYQDLVSWGIQFYEKDGVIPVDGPHRFRDIPPMYEVIGMKNRAFAPSLRSKAMSCGVRVYDRMMVCELLKQDGAVVGAMGFHTTSGTLYVFHAKAVVICTGAGTAYKVRAMNTDFWTGDGECMAYRIGASISGKEFRQANNPATREAIAANSKLYQPGPLQGKLLDITKKYPDVTVQSGWFWPTVDAESRPAIDGGAWNVHCGRAPLYYDMDHLSPAFQEHNKEYFERVGDAEPRKLGIDFFDGGKLYYPSVRVQLNSAVGGTGIWPTDKYCASEIPGLFAAGASCATMTSGARYGGMGVGLTGGMVTGARAAIGVANYIKDMERPVEIREEVIAKAREVICAPMDRIGGFSPAWLTQALQGTVVPYYIFLIKKEDRLNAALTMVTFMKEHLVPLLKANDPHEWRLAIETKNMVLDAEMQLRASLFRKESRGAHYREDYPRRRDPYGLFWTRLHEVDGKMEAFKEPVPERFWPDLTKPEEELYPWPLPVPEDYQEPEDAAGKECG